MVIGASTAADVDIGHPDQGRFSDVARRVAGPPPARHHSPTRSHAMRVPETRGRTLEQIEHEGAERATLAMRR
jgi:hypothetical protein